MLADDLKAKLDTSSLVTGLLGAVGAAGGKLGAIVPAISPDQVSAHAGLSANVSTDGISGSIGGVGDLANGLIAGLPNAADALRPITAVLETVEAVSAGEPSAQIQALIERLSASLSGPRGAGFLDLLSQLAGSVSSAPELKGLIDLLRTVFQAAAIAPNPFETLAEVPSAAMGTIRSLGALMSLKTLLVEGDRLTRIMAAQLAPTGIGLQLTALRAKFAEGAAAISAYSSAGGSDPDQARTALDTTSACALKLNEVSALLAQAMGFGEATLIHLDLAGLKAGLQTAGAMLRSVDVDSIGRGVKALIDRLAPGFKLDLRAAAANSLDALLTAIEHETTNIAATITAVNVTVLGDPLKTGLAQVTSIPDALAKLITQVTSTIRGALEQIRQAIARLPFDQIARSIQDAIAPVRDAMDAIGQLIQAAEAALKTMAQDVTTALSDVEAAVDTAKNALQALFKAAHDFLNGLHLDQASSTIAGDVHDFTNLLAKAQMKPYFDTATGAINTAASAIGALPLGLMPDSMKADLDAAIAPVRAIDVGQVKDEIEGLLEIQGGHFEMRGALAQAIASIKQDFDALLAQLAQADPKQLIATIDGALADIKQKIDTLLPQINLKPLDDAIAAIKGALASFDPRALLAPVSEIFAKILAAVDEFSPDKLIKPIEDRVKDAREKIVGLIALRDWGPHLDALDTQARSLIDFLDPARLGLEALLADALGEANALLAQLDTINLWAPLGDFIASLFAGAGAAINSSSFDAIVQWLSGASGANELTAHAHAIETAISSTRDAVQGIDLGALSTDLAQNAAAMQTAAASLAAGVDLNLAIQTSVARLDVDGSLAPLVANQARYLSELADTVAIASTIADTGLSQADAAITALAGAFAPAAIFADFRDKLLAQLGLGGITGGLGAILRSVLSTITAPRLAQIFDPIIGAVHGRISALLDSVITPVRDAINRLVADVDVIDLAPLRKSIDAVFQQVRTEIEALDPMKILAPVLQSFDTLKTDLAAFDPLKDLRAIIAALTTTADRVIAKLSANAILAEPIAIFEQILTALRAIDPQTLLAPVLDSLDQIASQAANGLDQVAKALERLQASLPAPGGGPAGAALSVAGSLGVSL